MVYAETSAILGEPNAPILITEFTDFECPFCARVQPTLNRIRDAYGDQVQFEFKHFPLPMHRHGQLSAQYAECAVEQGKFWPYHDLLLDRQGNWKRLADARPAFDRMAGDADLDIEQLKSCVDSRRVKKIIEKNKNEGNSRGIRSTPTYFINGKMVVGQQSLARMINKYLAESKGN